MSKIMNNLKYAKTHEWVKVEGNVAVVGITDYAQHSLGSIVYLEANEIGETVKQFGTCGVVESVKAASDIMSPLSGENH
jgi:glycine cleavage system H protein